MIMKEIAGRRSVRTYKPDPVSDETVLELIKAAEFAPSGRHIKPIEYIIIRDQETKNRVFDLFGDQFIKDAPVLIILTADTKKSALFMQDLSIASGYVFLQAHALGLGTVWKNVSEPNTEKLKAILGIPANFTVINLIPVGYPAENLSPHADNEFEPGKIHKEKF